jgi:3-hydroxyacyl-CoA dehydrogenase
MVEAGEASIVGVDGAALAAGYVHAPLCRLDEVGLDVDIAAGERLAADWDSQRFLAPALQQRLVAEGRRGRDAGRGFYRYLPDGRSIPDVEIALVAPLTDEAVLERLELAVVNEAYRVVDDGLATPAAIDEVMRREAGFPRGPFEIVDELGLRLVVERLRALHAQAADRSGDQYSVARLLWQMATL